MAKKKCPEAENHERWLVAFADMMTLLFCLFVVLYSIANVEMTKLKQVSHSVQVAFGFNKEAKDGDGFPGGNSRFDTVLNKNKGNTNRDSMQTRNRREIAAIISADTKKLEQNINQRLYGDKEQPTASQGKKDAERVVFINKDQEGIRITLLARKFFNPNETELNFAARSILSQVALAVKDMGKVIRVEGHTDNIPFNLHGLSNWELSANRASSVVKYLISQHNFDPQMIYPAGFADTKPISPNTTPENRSMNRRVDIKILYDNPSEYQPDDLSDPPADGENTPP